MKKPWIWAIVLLCIAGAWFYRRRLGLTLFTGGPGGVTKVVHCDQQYIDENMPPQFYDSVAGVAMNTGVMYLNMPLIKQLGLSNEELLFVMLHENAHMVLGTTNEERVDELAHRQYMELGYSLRKSVTALTRVLRFDKTEDYRRANAQLARAKQYDYEHHR